VVKKFPEHDKLLVQLLKDLGTWQPTKEMVNKHMNAYITAFKETQTNRNPGKKMRLPDELQNNATGTTTCTKRRMELTPVGEVDAESIVRNDLLVFSKDQNKDQNNTFKCLWFMLSAYDPTLGEISQPQVDGMGCLGQKCC
jgi:hypothetical protein